MARGKKTLDEILMMCEIACDFLAKYGNMEDKSSVCNEEDSIRLSDISDRDMHITKKLPINEKLLMVRSTTEDIIFLVDITDKLSNLEKDNTLDDILRVCELICNCLILYGDLVKLMLVDKENVEKILDMTCRYTTITKGISTKEKLSIIKSTAEGIIVLLDTLDKLRLNNLSKSFSQF